MRLVLARFLPLITPCPLAGKSGAAGLPVAAAALAMALQGESQVAQVPSVQPSNPHEFELLSE